MWSFPKEELNTATTDANLGVDETLSAGETEVVESELPEGVTAQTVSFAHSGDLPGTATVQVPLTQQLDTNEELGLYYIDEETGKLELQETEVTVADGNLQFDIEHCSSYLVAAKSDMDKTPAAPDAPAATATPAPTAAPADGIVYYTCPACGHHDWTATDAGYRCDACGYLESVKQQRPGHL